MSGNGGYTIPKWAAWLIGALYALILPWVVAVETRLRQAEIRDARQAGYVRSVRDATERIEARLDRGLVR